MRRYFVASSMTYALSVKMERSGVGAARGEDHERAGDGQTENQCARGGFLDSRDVLFSPVAGRDDNRTVRDAVDDHLQEKLDLVDDEHAGEGQLGIPSDHDVVEQVDAVDDDVLECDGDEEFTIPPPEVRAGRF